MGTGRDRFLAPLTGVVASGLRGEGLLDAFLSLNLVRDSPLPCFPVAWAFFPSNRSEGREVNWVEDLRGLSLTWGIFSSEEVDMTGEVSDPGLFSSTLSSMGRDG